jgi:hypothetical protein
MEDVSALKELPWVGPRPASGFAAAANAAGRRTHARSIKTFFVVPKVSTQRACVSSSFECTLLVSGLLLSQLQIVSS